MLTNTDRREGEEKSRKRGGEEREAERLEERRGESGSGAQSSRERPTAQQRHTKAKPRKDIEHALGRKAHSPY